MYKVYIDGLLKTLSEHCFAISINSLSIPSPSFADDVTLLALFLSFLQTLMNLCHNYSLRWRYQFNHIKNGVVTFGECKPIHSKLMKERKNGFWVIPLCMSYASIKISEFWKITQTLFLPMFKITSKKPAKSRNDFCLQLWPSQNKTSDLHKILERRWSTFPFIWGGVIFTHHYSTESTWELPAVVLKKDLLRTTVCTRKISFKSIWVKFRRIRDWCEKALVSWPSYYWNKNGLSSKKSFLQLSWQFF